VCWRSLLSWWTVTPISCPFRVRRLWRTLGREPRTRNANRTCAGSASTRPKNQPAQGHHRKSGQEVLASLWCFSSLMVQFAEPLRATGGTLCVNFCSSVARIGLFIHLCVRRLHSRMVSSAAHAVVLQRPGRVRSPTTFHACDAFCLFWTYKNAPIEARTLQPPDGGSPNAGYLVSPT
jgi:hypothetical protein